MSTSSGTTEDLTTGLANVSLSESSASTAVDKSLSAKNNTMPSQAKSDEKSTKGTDTTPSSSQTTTHASGKSTDKYLNEQGGEDLSLILAEEEAAQKQMTEMREKHGLDHEETLEACIRMLESWISLYKLKPMDDLIVEILPLCKARGGALYIKCLQMKAFMRFKQFRYKESLDLFYEFKELVGPSPELLENMGHTHNTLGEHKEAVQCFTEAFTIQKLRLQLVQEEYTKEQKEKGLEVNEEELNKATHHIHMQTGGLLMGLGTSYKRMGKLEESLKYMLQALNLYKQKFNNQDHSLVAKTLTGLADLYTQMGKLIEAHQAHLEAVRIFKITCGISPLTANALVDLGQSAAGLAQVATLAVQKYSSSSGSKTKADKLSQQQQQQLITAQQQEYLFLVLSVKSFDEAFELHCGFDTLALPQIITIATSILENKPKLLGKPYPELTSPALGLQDAFKIYKHPIITCLKTIQSEGLTETDDSAVFYKSAGELLLLGGEIDDAIELLKKAKSLFEKVTSIDCTSLINTCGELIETGKALKLRK